MQVLLREIEARNSGAATYVEDETAFLRVESEELNGAFSKLRLDVDDAVAVGVFETFIVVVVLDEKEIIPG